MDSGPRAPFAASIGAGMIWIACIVAYILFLIAFGWVWKRFCDQFIHDEDGV